MTNTPLPAWEVSDLPEPEPAERGWRHWAQYIGPGIVMMGIQIGGGEWLLGPQVTAKYGGGLMWIATVAIVLQVFYNMECGRYALYCGEPIFTGFMRCWPGPWWWFGLMILLNVSAIIPGLSTHGAAIIASLILDRPPTIEDGPMIRNLALACLLLVSLPILIGGKVYNMLQFVMTAKVVCVLSFCLGVGIFCVSGSNWWNVFSGFARFGNVPVATTDGKEVVVNGFAEYWRTGFWPAVSIANIVMLGAFAGYAGGGGLANSTYSNFVRDKGWGMGKLVGAIPSAIGGRQISLSHVGKVFPLNGENLRRWRGWWRYVLTDQLLIWTPGCFMGMALPALLSLQFAGNSTIDDEQMRIAQAVVTSDGLRQAIASPIIARVMWTLALLTGLMVMLPSQMAIVDDFSRRWTDAIWTASSSIRRHLRPDQVSLIYYGILGTYVGWSFFCAHMFSNAPKLMTDFIANFNNLAIGITSFQLLWINHRLLPRQLRPAWYQSLGVLACGVFYLGLAGLVVRFKILPMLYSQ